jgi:hypothetical protein|tara:strand:+ start:952 stop:1059 length:108 start_codon:yes stop_codon:yes gene_type:complete
MNWRAPQLDADEPIMEASNDPETTVEKWSRNLKTV